MSKFDYLSKFIPGSVSSRQPELVRALIDATDASGTATVTAIIGKLSETAPQISRPEVIKFLQKLGRAATATGRFIVGRRGQPSRFDWSQSVFNDQSINEGAGDSNLRAKVRTDESSDRHTVLAPHTPSNQPTLYHSYNLRPHLQISFVLPPDLTRREAERLSEFIKSLPLE